MKSEKLIDLESLTLMVRDPKSRENIREAVNAYYGGAYRASIVSTWIAVAFDIIEKMKELAAYDDPQAIKLIEELQNRVVSKDIRWLSEFELNLLQDANEKFELISADQKQSLERIKEDRNKCAHPAFTDDGTLFDPLPETVRSHIAHAVNDLLRHAPVRGKSSLKAIVDDIQNEAFPASPDLAGRFLFKKYLEYSRPNLKTNLISLLVKALLKNLSDWQHKQKPARIALEGIQKQLPKQYDNWMQTELSKLLDQVPGERMFRVCGLIVKDLRIWNWIGEQHRIQIKDIFSNLRLMETSKTKRFPEGSVFAVIGDILSDMQSGDIADKAGVAAITELFKLSEIEELSSELESIFSRFSWDNKLKVISKSPSKFFVDEGIKLFTEAGSFRGAEQLGQGLLVPLAPYFTIDDVQQILQVTLTNNQIYGASGMDQILTEWIKNLTQRNDLNFKDIMDWQAYYDQLTSVYDSYQELGDFLCSTKLISLS